MYYKDARQQLSLLASSLKLCEKSKKKKLQ